MGLNSILSQLGIGNKETVYLSVTPGVGLELIQLDIAAKTVKNYAYKPLAYNESLREISDISTFKEAVLGLFDELNINIKSNVVLNLPMVLLGTKNLPILLGDDNITEALTSEVEQSYIFKRYEPVVSWYDANSNQSGDSRKLFYSALQKNVIDDIKNVLTELGANLVDIQISLVSLLKALSFSGVIDDQIQDNVSWNLMLISSNGYSICSMVGSTLVEYYEEPLAIKSFEGDEIYNAISASAQIALMSYPANSLCVVSETDMVSAEVLASKLSSDVEVKYVENNVYKKQDIIDVSLEIIEEAAHKISLEAIGVALGNSVNLPIKLNFLGGTAAGAEDPDSPVHIVLGSSEFDLSPNMAKVYSIIVAFLLIIPMGLLAFAVPFVVKQKQSQLDQIEANLKNVQAEINSLDEKNNKYQNFDINNEIKKVLSNNRSKLMAYIALGESVPKKLWLTYFVAKGDGKFDIKGVSTNVEDVYTFYRNLKDSLINTQLKLHKLELKSDIDEVVSIDANQAADYEFEITNMSPSDLDPQIAEDGNSEDGKKTEENNDQKKGKMLNKPLLNLGNDRGEDGGEI